MTDFSHTESQTESTPASAGMVAPPSAESAQLSAGVGVLMQRLAADEAAA